ncbi:unnamed protein product [Caretta caretta]
MCVLMADESGVAGPEGQTEQPLNCYRTRLEYRRFICITLGLETLDRGQNSQNKFEGTECVQTTLRYKGLKKKTSPFHTKKCSNYTLLPVLTISNIWVWAQYSLLLIDRV